MTCEKTISRMIFRDATGKYSWDVSNLFEVIEESDIKSRLFSLCILYVHAIFMGVFKKFFHTLKTQ